MRKDCVASILCVGICQQLVDADAVFNTGTRIETYAYDNSDGMYSVLFRLLNIFDVFFGAPAGRFLRQPNFLVLRRNERYYLCATLN